MDNCGWLWVFDFEQGIALPRGFAEYWPWVLAGCVVADALHMVKDGFGPVEIVFGR